MNMLASLFSTKDMVLIALIMILPPLSLNLAFKFLQDLILSFAIYLGALILTPIVIKLIVGKDPYQVLTFKALGGSGGTGKSFTTFLIITLAVSCGLSLVGVWFGLLPGFNSLIAPAPFFSRTWVNYIYMVGGLAIAIPCITIEHKFYYGVLCALLPDGIAEIIGIVVFQTLHWIGFAFAVTTSTTNALLLILLIAGIYLCLKLLADKESYESSTKLHIIVYAVNYVLMAVFVILKYNRKFNKGIAFGTVNKQNIWNKVF